MNIESLKKNIIFEDHRRFDIILSSEIEKIKDNQINNTTIDLIISEIFSDKDSTQQEQFSRYLISSPETTSRLKEDFLVESKENLSDLLSKFQMTNIMNKEFLIFFDYNKKESYAQLIILNNLNSLIEHLVNIDKTSTPNGEESDLENLKFCLTIINIIYISNNNNEMLKVITKNEENSSRLEDTIRYYNFLLQNYWFLLYLYMLIDINFF